MNEKKRSHKKWIQKKETTTFYKVEAIFINFFS